MLSIIGTPIGNLRDLSVRAADTLMSADIVLTEDTRSFDTVLHQAQAISVIPRNPTQQVWSYYKQVEFEKLPDIIDRLNDETHIALMSEAGMPVISDPGHLLISTVRKRGLAYTVIPGPSAVDTAVVACGLKHAQFLFAGFFPKKQQEISKLLAYYHQLAEHIDDMLFVAYESPERVRSTCELIRSQYPSSRIVLCRELTKKFEQVIQIDDVVDWSNIKGEIALTFIF